MEIEIGKSVLERSGRYVNERMERVNFVSLRGYFNVDNRFVLRKLSLMMFPFNNNEWAFGSEDGLSRPELYIPTMSFVSYIVLRALYLGLEGKFSPERLGMMFSRSVFLELGCIVAVRISGYFIDVHLHVLDILAYDGYKYVSVLLLQLFRFRYYVRAIVGMYLYVSFFFFLSRSLKRRVLGEHGGQKSKKIYYLFAVVLVQVVIIFLLS